MFGSCLPNKVKLLFPLSLYCNSLFCSFRLLSALQLVADNILVNETLLIVKKNIAMGVKKVNPRQNSGIIIQAKATNKSNVNDLTLNNSFKYDRTSEDIASIFLSEALLKKAKKITGIIDGVQRVTTFIFDNEKLFSTNVIHTNSSSMSLNKKLNSKILSASLKNVPSLKNLTGKETVRSTFSYLKTKKGKTECVFWDFSSAGMLLFVYEFYI